MRLEESRTCRNIFEPTLPMIASTGMDMINRGNEKIRTQTSFPPTRLICGLKRWLSENCIEANEKSRDHFRLVLEGSVATSGPEISNTKQCRGWRMIPNLSRML